MFAEYVGRSAVVECGAETQAPRHVADDPPVRPRLTRRRQEGALSGNAPLRIGHCAVLLAPRGGRQQELGAGLDSVVAENSETTNSSSLLSAARIAPARGSDTAGLVAITHKALMVPRSIAANMLTALRPSDVAMRGAPQNRRTRSVSAGENPI